MISKNDIFSQNEQNKQSKEIVHNEESQSYEQYQQNEKSESNEQYQKNVQNEQNEQSHQNEKNQQNWQSQKNKKNRQNEENHPNEQNSQNKLNQQNQQNEQNHQNQQNKQKKRDNQKKPIVTINIFFLSKNRNSSISNQNPQFNINSFLAVNNSPIITFNTFFFNMYDSVQNLVKEINNSLNKKKNDNPSNNNLFIPNEYYSYGDNYRIWIINPIKAEKQSILTFLKNKIQNKIHEKGEIKFTFFDRIHNSIFHPYLIDNFILYQLYRIFPNYLNPEFFGDIILDSNNNPLINLLVEEKPYYLFSGINSCFINFCSCCKKLFYLFSGCICNKVFYCSKECKIKNLYDHLIKCKIGLINIISQDNERLKKKITDENIDIKKPTLKGLVNISNYCFMTSVFQSLICIEEFRNYFLIKFKNEDNINNCKTKGLISLSFYNLLLNMIVLKKDSYYNPYIFELILSKYFEYQGMNQWNDAKDFLYKFIEKINKELKRKCNEKKANSNDIISNDPEIKEFFNDTSIVKELFFGVLKSSMKCATCNSCQVSNDLFNIIKIDIKKNLGETLNLEQCLNSFIKGEKLNNFECYSCKQKNSFLKIESLFIPKIFIIALNRFNNNFFDKTYVNCPIKDFDLNKYANNDNNKQIHNNMKYNLISMIKYIGSEKFGHFISYSKYNEKWYEFNYQSVNPVEEKNIMTGDAYILFYRRKEESIENNPETKINIISKNNNKKDKKPLIMYINGNQYIGGYNKKNKNEK